MKNVFALLCSVALAAGLQAAELNEATEAAPAVAKEAAAPDTAEPAGVDMSKVSYAIGFKTGQGMKQQGLELVKEEYLKGFADGQADKESAIAEEEMEQLLQAFQMEMMMKMQAKRQAASAQNMADGKKFLEENAKQEGWKTTKSGLQYKVITEGKGAKPKATDTVEVHYRGTLIDGKEFDSSYKRGEPATFPVNGVIKGWTEALQMMPVGSKWQIVLPPELAYGERGAGQDIGPNAVLRFEVELLDIKGMKSE